jgi:hypothetical protein
MMVSSWPSKCAIKDKSVKVNGQILIENQELCGTFKISYGKKKHAFKSKLVKLSQRKNL